MLKVGDSLDISKKTLTFAHSSLRIFTASVVSTLFLLFAGNVAAATECTEAEVNSPSAAECFAKSPPSKTDWIDAVMGARPFGLPLSVSRFLDRTYYLNREMDWTPKAATPTASKIVVPKGFVTDFASVPRIFWAVLAPDDDYVMPAVIHDWLYWQQTLSRREADLILKLAMEELNIASWKVTAIYVAVSTFGSSAWDENAKRKVAGERRVLNEPFPSDATIRWSDWKQKANTLR